MKERTHNSPQAFGPASNATLKWVLLFIFAITLVSVSGWTLWTRSSRYGKYQAVVNQPILFSHRHHAGDLAIDCRYCHQNAEDSPVAGMPASEVCWSCHSQIFTESPMLEPLRQSITENKPIAWNRVTDLKDVVYFDHSAHLAHGISCQTCHGDVANMAMTYQEKELTMRWCLDCHRKEDWSSMTAEHPFQTDSSVPAPVILSRPPESHEAILLLEGKSRTDCYTCHR